MTTVDDGGGRRCSSGSPGLRAAGMPVRRTGPRAFAAARQARHRATGGRRDLAGRAALCRARRPGALRPGLPRLLRRRDGLLRPSPVAAADHDAQPVAAALDEGSGTGTSPAGRTSSARRPARSRCCGTATVAALTAAEKHRVAGMFATLRPPARRRTARHQRWHRGQVDASRTLRASLRRMEPADIAWRRRDPAPAGGALVDVSGSMSGYADALLRLAHRFTQAGAGRSRRSRSAPASPT